MKKFALAVAALGALATASTGAMAAQVDKRENRQEHRIYNGVKSGDLSHRETKKLVRGQEKVQKLERRAKADGVLTARERARLQQAQNVQSRKIYRAKNN